MAKNRSKKYKECFIKRRTADVQEIFLFCCLSNKKIYFVLPDKSMQSFSPLLCFVSRFVFFFKTKYELRECFPNLPFPHEDKRKNGHMTNAKRTNICQVGFSTDTRTDPFFVVAENSVTESVYFGEPVYEPPSLAVRQKRKYRPNNSVNCEDQNTKI